MKLPKTLYARVERDGEETYIIASASLDDACEESGATTIGTYTLNSKDVYTRITTLAKED